MKVDYSQFIGKQFGNLQILDFVKVPKCNYQEMKAVCKCLACGGDYTGSFWPIKSGGVTACGCKRATGYKQLRGTLWSGIQRRAMRRGHEFKLTIAEAWNLYEKQKGRCALSGLSIVFSSKTSKETVSLDRIDSKIGYLIGNVQWVHKAVNIMKNMFSQDVFIDLCRRVAETHSSIRLEDKIHKSFHYKNEITFGNRNADNVVRVKDASSKLLKYSKKRARIENKVFWTPEQDELMMQMREEGRKQKDIS